MRSIKMPINTYYFLLKSVPCTDPLLIPHHSVTNEDAAEQYIRARDYWISRNWMKLDFDGSLQLYPELARFVYNISHIESVFRWEDQKQTEYWIKGPVDILYVRETIGNVELRLIGNSALLRYIKRALGTQPNGFVSAKRMGTENVVSGKLSGKQPLSENMLTPEQLLADCMALVYGGVEDA